MLGENFIYPQTTADQVVVGIGTENERRLEVDGKVEADSLSGKSLSDIMLMVYPVGSIYMSMNEISPQTLFGGTWERLKDRFLLGAGDNEVGNVGGETWHTHTHSFYVPWYTVGNSMVYGAFKDVGSWTTRWKATSVTEAEDVNTRSRALPLDGGLDSANNMPPYLTVNMWQRTA
jgi:hypothetical protein